LQGVHHARKRRARPASAAFRTCVKASPNAARVPALACQRRETVVQRLLTSAARKQICSTSGKNVRPRSRPAVELRCAGW
jgi:hypothetical protein